jgi:hypothetical protein
MRETALLKTSLLLCLACSLVFVCENAWTFELSVFGGGEIDQHAQGFTFAGMDLGKSVTPNVVLAARIIPNYLTYKFKSGDILVRASSPGLYALLGGKVRWGETSLGLFGGTEFRHTDLSPDVQRKVRGDTTSGMLQGEFDSWLPSRTNLNAFINYSGTDNFLYQRARLKQQITNYGFQKPNTFNLGIEEIYGRNPDFREIGFGLLGELYNIPHFMAVSVHGGYKHDSTFGNGEYIGIEIYKAF